MEKIIVGNFKMNLNKEEIIEYIEKIKRNKNHTKAIYCPSFLYIPYFRDENMKVGAQNISSFEKGAHTGEISAKQIKSMGVSHVIIGHSERRNIETEEDIHLKIKESLKEGLKVILCIGEKEEEKAKRKEILERQIKSAVKDLKGDIIIAYEPIWAIGTGKVMEEKEIKEVALFIKKIRKEAKILYGGSVNEENIKNLSNIKEVDGFLVGGASIHPEVFLKIIEVAVTM